MPARKVIDLIEFNKQAPDDFKVGIRIHVLDSRRLYVSFCLLHNGENLYQRSEERKKYYELPGNYKWTYDDESRAGIERFHEPQSEKLLFPWGAASCKRNPKLNLFPCYNAWIISVTEAAQGYGPMLYDCMMVKLAESGLGIVADRSLVSPQAAKVWANYLTSRPDVKKVPLDLDGSTPSTEDDCYSEHDRDSDWNTWVNHTEETKEKHQTMRLAVNHAYFDNGIKTLDDLREAGLIYDESTMDLRNSDPINETNIFLQKLYKSILKT